MQNKKKMFGQIFTEYSEVQRMFKMYSGNILKAKIMEPSFGNGSFLKHIITKIIEEAKKEKIPKNQIADILNKNICGYEIDKAFYRIALNNINTVLMDKGITKKIKWKNLKNISTFFSSNKNKYDLIIGNPPYVKVQNFDEGLNEAKSDLKNINGNTDLFLMFIDFLIKKLKENGTLIFIVPNSLGKSKSAQKLREYMLSNGSVKYLDFEDKQLFTSVSVYSCIFKYSHNSNEKSTYQVGYAGKSYKMINNKMFLPENIYKSFKINVDLGVKNGLATLADRLFIFPKGREPNIEKKYLYPIVKASRQNLKFIAIFPYKKINKKISSFLDENELKTLAPKLYKYLSLNKKALLNRSLEKRGKWYEYGRSQGTKDLSKKKWIIDTLIKPGQKALKIKDYPKNTLIFSGLYSTTDTILKYNNEKLIKSLRFKARDMRGRYKKISSSLLKNDF